MTPEPDDVGAVVVLHKAFPQVLATIEDVIREGVAPTRVLVVDNSEDPQLHRELVAALPVGVRAMSIPNAGYANAVNAGAREMLNLDRGIGALLVVTHEVRFAPGSVAIMRGAFEGEGADVVGPLLLDADAVGENRIWSAGGTLSKMLKLPSHLQGGRSMASAQVNVVACDWVDGAASLYKAECLRDFPLNESFFLYFEELEHHARLREAGRRIVVCPDARASQSSKGVPPRLLGRNMQLFQFLHGTAFSVLFAVPYVGAKHVVKVLIRRAEARDLLELMTGWLGAWRERGAIMRPAPTGRS